MRRTDTRLMREEAVIARLRPAALIQTEKLSRPRSQPPTGTSARVGSSLRGTPKTRLPLSVRATRGSTDWSTGLSPPPAACCSSEPCTLQHVSVSCRSLQRFRADLNPQDRWFESSTAHPSRAAQAVLAPRLLASEHTSPVRVQHGRLALRRRPRRQARRAHSAVEERHSTSKSRAAVANGSMGREASLDAAATQE